MKKKIAILGSTGSIGKTLLKIVKKDQKIKIILLTANKNYKELLKQAKLFKVKNIIITDLKSFNKALVLNKNKNLNIFNNFEIFKKIFRNKINYIMSSIVGLEGLYPTLEAIKYTDKIAIANKESLVCGWNLIEDKSKKYKTEIIPIDSEHFSVWSLLDYRSIIQKKSINNKLIDEIYITASGGPFKNYDLNKFKNIKPSDATKHPNWKMGKKISVDSSTLMNKVFEVIELQRLFKIDYKKIKVIIQPKSYIHAIIRFADGTIKLLAHEPDMIVPIFNSVYDKKNIKLKSKKINFEILNQLNFTNIDKKKFPLINLIHKLKPNFSLFETALTVANDELVRLFLNNKISYTDLSKILINFLNSKYVLSLSNKKPLNYMMINTTKKLIRLKIKNHYNQI